MVSPAAQVAGRRRGRTPHLLLALLLVALLSFAAAEDEEADILREVLREAAEVEKERLMHLAGERGCVCGNRSA